MSWTRGQQEPDNATDHREHEAFRQQLPRNPSRSRAERCVNGQFLLAPLGAHEEQIGHIGTGDQQDNADRAEQDPQHPANVSNHVLREWPHVRPEAHLLEHLLGESRWQWETLPHERNHPRDVCVRLRNRDSRFEPGDSLVAEVADEHLGTIDTEWQDELRIGVQKLEAGGKNPDDFARRAIDGNLPTDDRRIAPELAYPVRIREHRPLGRLRRIVVSGEPTAEYRLNPEHRERAIGDRQHVDTFRFADAGHRYGIGIPEPAIFERPSFFTIREIEGRSLVQQRNA